MSMDCSFRQWKLSSDRLRQLICRCDYFPLLLRREIEEEITTLVNPSLDPGMDRLQAFWSGKGLETSEAQAGWFRARDWILEDSQRGIY